MLNSRQKAIQKTQKYYDTKKPCKHGHLSKRITIDGSCYQCRMDSQRKERQRVAEKFKAAKDSSHG